LNVAALGRRGSAVVTLALGQDTPMAVAEALAALIRGWADRRAVVRDTPSILVPTRADALTALYSADRADLAQVVSRYRDGRDRIEQILASAIPA
jgi:hypothetical protein